MSDGPPFRAEHIGSLLRPASLRAARREREAGTLSEEEFAQQEDRAILDAIALQEALGLRSITDGEFRRHTYFGHFAQAVDGFTEMVANLTFGDASEPKMEYKTDVVNGRLKRARGIATKEYSFVAAHTSGMPKVTLPSPSGMHHFRFREGVSDVAYPDVEEFFDDLARVYREELHELGELGATYVQLDDVAFPFLCDPARRAEAQDRGYEPDWLIDRYVALTNEAIAERPAGMTIGMHLCRGNNQGKWVSEGGYDYIAEKVFPGVNVDVFFLEYDSERAGGFQPLRHVSADKDVVLGLISSKIPEMENREDVLHRIEEASRYMPMERLELSPQCGFASVEQGNPVTSEDQRRKLELVVEIAATAWR